MKYFTVFLNALIWIPVWVDWHEYCFKVKILILFALLHDIHSSSHLVQWYWADVWTKCEPKVYQVILALEVFMSDWVTFCIIQYPITTYLSFSSIWCSRFLFLRLEILLIFFLSIELNYIGEQENNSHGKRCEEHDIIWEPSFFVELFPILLSWIPII